LFGRKYNREEFVVNIQQVREKARSFGLKVGKSKKIELIKDIQKVEGNFDCFATAVSGYCDQADCSWREDCFVLAEAKKM
jgi:hypothetical protein